MARCAKRRMGHAHNKADSKKITLRNARARLTGAKKDSNSKNAQPLVRTVKAVKAPATLKPLTTFSIFPKLPPELRVKVWGHSLSNASQKPRLIALSHKKFKPVPALLHTNAESRVEALKQYKLVKRCPFSPLEVKEDTYVYINPRVDYAAFLPPEDYNVNDSDTFKWFVEEVIQNKLEKVTIDSQLCSRMMGPYATKGDPLDILMASGILTELAISYYCLDDRLVWTKAADWILFRNPWKIDPSPTMAAQKVGWASDFDYAFMYTRAVELSREDSRMSREKWAIFDRKKSLRSFPVEY